jgi:HD-like signal output (HDOD) protein/ActR/RegA family two-component response regulator
MMPTILFVDAEPFVHKALRRTLRAMQDRWILRFTADPDVALALLAGEPVDVLITELVFPNHSGPDFLKAVRERYPRVVRIILSGYADRNIIVQSVDLAHQFLAKPCEDSQLTATIRKSFLVKGLLDHEPLKQVVGRIHALPSLPTHYLALMKALQSPDITFEQVGALVARDLGLVTRLLKMVNSSYFGLAQQVSSPAKAVGLLGLKLVQTIVLAAGTFDQFKTIQRKGFSIERMWEHATQTAAMAKIIAGALGMDRPGVDGAFMAGMLHDIGKLLVAAHLPAEFELVIRHMERQATDMATAEMHILGTTHAAIGAYLLGLWGLPDTIIEAAAFHHNPAALGEQGLGPVAITHIANAFAHAGSALDDIARPIMGLDDDFMAGLGLTPRLRQLQILCARSP